MELGTALTAIDFALAKAKHLADLLKTANEVEAGEVIVELRAALLDVKEENIRLRERVQALETDAKLAQELTFAGGVYWRK